MTEPTPDRRPDADALLRETARAGRGRLKVFLGAAPGVGKTYAMLAAGRARRRDGTDVAIGVVETHGRRETEAMVRGLEIVPQRRVAYRGRDLAEMDLDALLARHPRLALVDELAHSNAPGSRHDKRWQDVEELLDAGIDVYSTLNVQHLESLNDVVASFTQVRVRETLPDRVIEQAEIQLVDLPPDDLIDRLKQGKVYVPDEATRALDRFFSRSNLAALRELALRRAAQAVDSAMLDYLRAHALGGAWAAGERILVAVDASPAAAGLVRAGKRLADALRGPWTALHIETPATQAADGEDGARRLADTLHLAGQLGGQVVSVPAETVPEGIRRFVEESRATQLIVGRARPVRLIDRARFALSGSSLVDRLARTLPDISLHVLPVDALRRPAPARPPARRTPPAHPTRWTDHALALALVALTTAAGTLLFSAGNVTNIGLLYLLPVMVAALRYGLPVGLVTGIASSLAYNFFFLPPVHTFTIQDPRNILTVLVLLGVAVVSSQLAARVRAQALLAQRSAAQNSALAGFARLLTAAGQEDELAHILCGEVGRLLDVETLLLLPHEGELRLCGAVPPDVRLEGLDMAAARWALEHNQPAGRGSGTLGASEWLFQPLSAGGHGLGVFGLARPDLDRPVRPDRLPLLLSLLDQAALALERIRLSREMASVAQLRERDRLRAALLSSISHDLRTPLTAIIGTLALMRADGAEQADLLKTARAEAERLNRFVANLLDMVRIEAGALHLATEPVDLAEAVAAAVHDLRRGLAHHPVELDVSPDLPLVRVDPQLFHHCLINLLENAAKYGDPGAPVTVRAQRRPGSLTLSVIDRGPGIPPGEEERIFGTFARVEGSDRKGGTGLGLAIVKGFAEAMGLSVEAGNRSDRPGACFTLRFPEPLLIRSLTAE